MRSTALLVLALAFGLLPGDGRAQDYVSVGEMMERCQRPDGDFFKTNCFTYVGAVLDVQDQFALHAPGKKRLCVPPRVLARQAAAVFVQWATANPAQHHLPAAAGIVESLATAFPCSTP